MKYALAAAAILLGLLLFLPNGGSPSALTLVDLERTTHAKANLKARIAAAGLPLPDEAFCTARKAQPETVETMYKIFLYDRGDLTSGSEREAASKDILATYEFACGGDIVKMANTLSQSDDDVVHKAFVAAMVREGR